MKRPGAAVIPCKMLDRYIITLGGIQKFGSTCVNDVECYDTLANQWFSLTSLP